MGDEDVGDAAAPDEQAWRFEYWLLAASGPVLLGSALLGWQLSWLSASTATFCFLVLAALVARHSAPGASVSRTW